MNIDLSSMGLKELKDPNVAIARAIVGFEERKRIQALAALEAVSRHPGFSLFDLLGGGFAPGKRTRTLIVPKYGNPNSKAETWSSQGRKPLWFEAALSKGKSPMLMAVKAN